MILAALLLAAHPVEPETAIDAEYAFAKDAQEIGQWAAFIKWASPHGMLLGKTYVPVSVLEGTEEPEVPIYWWPSSSFVSCDGMTAVNTGPYYSPMDGEFGQFYTVWTKTDQGWRYRLDTGRVLKEPISLPRRPVVVQASCEEVTDYGSGDAPKPPHYDWGYSHDGSLTWRWFPEGDGRKFIVSLWADTEYEAVVNEVLPIP